MTSRTLTFTDASFYLTDKLSVTIGNLVIKPDSLIVLIGDNGSGKTSVAKALSGRLTLNNGVSPDNYHPTLVSFEEQMQYFEDDFKMRNSDCTTAEEEKGITPNYIFKNDDKEIIEKMVIGLKLGKLLDTPIRMLSGGEGRKVLLAHAIAQKPNLVVFDTPFDALDIATREELKELIAKIHQDYQTPVVLIVNRFQEIPDSLSAMGIIKNNAIIKIDSRENLMQDEDLKALLGRAQLKSITIPKTPVKYRKLSCNSEILVKFEKVNVTYGDKKVLDNLNLEIRKGENWLITGPNGAGKSTLLSLISGDNPQVYANEVTVFGLKRGHGESIWDIKQYLGMVSGALHLDYRVNGSALNVVLSGFYDSIGLYNKPSDDEVNTAIKWLRLSGLYEKREQSFRSMSFGQQRLLLIIRALIKMPSLLILDEPLQGLDGYARALVNSFISDIMQKGETTILYVSHHPEDFIEGFTHHLEFVKNLHEDAEMLPYTITIKKMLSKE